MAEERKPPDVPERSTPASPKTRALTLQLKELADLSDEKTPLDEYCHRPKEKLLEAYVSEVVESLRQEKQLEPIQVFKDERGKWQPLTGHRRIAALYILAKQGVAGFSPSMAVAALEVLGASPQDRLVRSVADNEVRQKLDQKERLLVVQKFARAGVSKERGAAALAISVKSYERDLRVAQQPQMLEHVLRDHVSPGDASALILTAEKNHRLKEFLDHFDGWVKRKEAEIEELDRLRKAEADKGLKPAELLVKNHLSQQVFTGWLEALERKAKFTEEAGFNFEATLDKKSGKLRLERLNIDTQEASVMDLVKVGAKLSQLGKRVLAMAQRKSDLEKLEMPSGAQAALAKDPSPYDREVLKEFGLEDVAPLLEMEVRAEEPQTPANEPEPEDNEEEPTGGE
jgi:ParB-like chromosome segregation protein Spo0J